MPKATHLIGAHGLFWDRTEIDWGAGRGSTYQLLGYRNLNHPALEVCDFRRARGIYILFNDWRATYVGRARGANDGIGYRLKAHDRDKEKDWSRFCWFSFDSVRRIKVPKSATKEEGAWAEVVRDEAGRDISADSAIDELEALMITAFGLHGSQNRMRLAEARQEWKQLTTADCWPGGVGRKVDGSRIKMPRLREALEAE